MTIPMTCSPSSTSFPGSCTCTTVLERSETPNHYNFCTNGSSHL
jgi:hypothetical protein